jgi:hypothetical protein
MTQYMQDIETINREQKAMTAVGEMLNAVLDNLSQLDGNATDMDELHLSTLPPDVVLFCVKRGILRADSSSSSDLINANFISTVNGIINGNTDSLTAWTQFSAMVHHYEQFAATTPSAESGNFPTNGVRNMYDPMYWRKASEMDDNPCQAMVGLGDHWVFDPRIRNSEGQILTNTGALWDGKDVSQCAYFSGFSSYSVANIDAATFTIYDKDGANGTAMGSSASKVAPDFSVIWFGDEPPSDVSHLENGTAGLMAAAGFLPGGALASDGKNNYTFSSSLKQLFLGQGSMKFTLDVSSSGKIAVTAIGTGASLGKNFWNDTFLTDYWELPKSVNGSLGSAGQSAYQTALSNRITSASAAIKLPNDRISAVADALRIYTEKVNNDSSSRASLMQSIQQSSQQSISTATNMLKSIDKNQQETTGNIR